MTPLCHWEIMNKHLKLGITFIFVSVTYSLICLYLSILGILRYKSENIFNFKTGMLWSDEAKSPLHVYGCDFFKSFVMKHFFSVLQRTFYMIQHWAIYFGGIFMSLIWFRFFSVRQFYAWGIPFINPVFFFPQRQHCQQPYLSVCIYKFRFAH